MSFQIVTCVPKERWQAYVDAHPHGNIYHTPAMTQVFRDARGYDPHVTAALDSQGEIRALLPTVDVTLVQGLGRRLSTRCIAYGGVLADPTPQGYAALLQVLRAHNEMTARRAIFTELRHMDDSSAWAGLLQVCGYIYEPHLNFLVDLDRSSEQLWASFNRTARKNIKRAEQAGLTSEVVHSRSGILAAYRLMYKVYTVARVPLASRTLFAAAWNTLSRHGQAHFVLARRPVDPDEEQHALGVDPDIGPVVAARATLCYKGRILDWYAGADRHHLAVRPNDFLVWETLKFGIEQGYKAFDFGGAGHPDEPYGVRDFKAKFNGRLVNYGRHRLVHRPLLARVASTVYEATRRFM